MEHTQSPAEGKLIEYTPVGSDLPIKLSPTIVINNLVTPTRSGKVPTQAQVINFMMLCRSRALNPFEGDAFLVGYDGKDGPSFSLITSIQAFLKRAEIHPQFNGFEAGVVVDGGERIEGSYVPKGTLVLAGWAKVYRKDRDRPVSVTVDRTVYDTGRSRWAIDPAGMIRKVALSQALRESFPSKLGGLYEADEMAKVHESPHIVADAPSRARVVEAVDAIDVEDGADLGPMKRKPGRPRKQPEPEPEPDASMEQRNELASLVTDSGFSFDDLRAWAVESGTDPVAGDWESFATMPGGQVTKFLNARNGLLMQLRAFKKAHREIESEAENA